MLLYTLLLNENARDFHFVLEFMFNRCTKRPTSGNEKRLKPKSNLQTWQ